jgi:ABC-type multidrug transport system permease subunit
MSEKVIKLIKKLVQQRDIPCVISLHQPRSSIFRMLDEVLLMAPGGRVCYHGNSREAIEYFRNLGYSCPDETNPAEFLVDLVSIDAEDPSAAPEDELRISRLADAFQEHQHKIHNAVFSTVTNVDVDDECKAVGSSKRERPRFLAIRRFRRLLLRSWRQNIRNNRVNFIRLMGSAGNAFLFSTIFRSVKKGEFTPKSVGDRVAMLSFGIINMSMIALLKTVDLFSKEKPVVQREQLRRQYSSFEYLLSKLVAEIPLDVAFAGIFTTVLKLTSGIQTGWKALTGTFALMTVSGASLGFAIGAMSPSAETAMSTAASIMVILMSVGVINPSGVDVSEPQPVFVAALKQVSPINFAVKAMCLTEYKNREFSIDKGQQNIFLRGRTILKDLPKMGGLALVQNGNQVLHELGLDKDTYAGCMRHLALLSLSNLVISWIGLQIQNDPKIAKSF